MFKLVVSKTESRRLRASAKPHMRGNAGYRGSSENNYELEEDKNQQLEIVWDPTSAPEKAVGWIWHAAKSILNRIFGRVS